jgi:hypothetical protein
MHGVLLPGAVVPGSVLGGLVGVPGGFREFEGFGVIPGTDPDPLLTAEHGGILPGVCVPDVELPGVEVPGVEAPGIAAPGVEGED